MKPNFRVLGAGIWGLAFSNYLMNLGHNVEVFCRDTNTCNEKNKNINVKSFNILNDCDASDAINIMAVNSTGFDAVLKKYKNYFQNSRELISLTKGIDHGTGLLFHSLVRERIGNDVKYGLISGPSFAKDLTNRKKISVSFASNDNDLTKFMVESTKSSYFDMIPISEIHHIEMAGIIKNIAAIICGMSDSLFGKGKHTNTIIKKASDETWKMSYEALSKDKFEYDDSRDIYDHLNKNKKKIITSPGYVGDMILTCNQDQSRNYQFGNLISDMDTSIVEAKNKIGTVEGYDCCITLVEQSSYAIGKLTKLLYEIIKCENTMREKVLKDFLQV